MTEEILLEDYKKAYKEIAIEEERMGFISHLISYIMVNLALIIVNLMYEKDELWFFYPLIGWGIGIVMHYLFGYRWADKELSSREAKAEYKVRREKRKEVVGME